jgi:hypothetical protein
MPRHSNETDVREFKQIMQWNLKTRKIEVAIGRLIPVKERKGSLPVFGGWGGDLALQVEDATE